MPLVPLWIRWAKYVGPHVTGENPEHLCCSGLAAEVAPPGILIRDKKESLLDGLQLGNYS